MLHCGNCGHSLHSDRNAAGHPISRERHGCPCGTNGRSVVSSRLDEQIGEVIRSVELQPDWRDRMAEFAISQEGPDLASLRTQRRRLARAYADGVFAEGEYRARLAEVDARIRATSTTGAPAVEDAAELFENLPALWEEAEPDERRRLVAPLIERVYVDLGSERVGGFSPSPAFRSLVEAAVRRSDSKAVILSSR